MKLPITAGVLPGRWGDYTSMSIDPARRLHFLVCEPVLCAGHRLTNFEWKTRVASTSFLREQAPASASPHLHLASGERAHYRDGYSRRAEPDPGDLDRHRADPGSYAIERAIGRSAAKAFISRSRPSRGNDASSPTPPPRVA